MFETRLYRISANDAIDKRKLWEGWLQWANRFSRLDSDNVARKQFSRTHFDIDAFLEMFSAGLDTTSTASLISGETGTMVAASKKFVSLDIFGEYWINWSITLKAISGQCRFAAGVPFIGNKFIGSAKDFKAEMGWYNNTNLSKYITLSQKDLGFIDLDNPTPVLKNKSWGDYGEWLGSSTPAQHVQTQVNPQDYPVRESSTNQGSDKSLYPIDDSAKIHLSGSGSAYVGRVSGNIGVLLFCQPGSEFQIISSRLTLHRRVR